MQATHTKYSAFRGRHPVGLEADCSATLLEIAALLSIMRGETEAGAMNLRFHRKGSQGAGHCGHSGAHPGTRG